MSVEHLEYLARTVVEVEQLVRSKEDKYNGSWKARGGIGAYFVSVRKFDALEAIAKAKGYDVFADLDQHGDGTLEDTLRDIVGYGLLILAERKRLRVAAGGTPEDGGQSPSIDDALEAIKGAGWEVKHIGGNQYKIVGTELVWDVLVWRLANPHQVWIARPEDMIKFVMDGFYGKRVAP